MNKTKIILAVVIVLILLAVAGFFFFRDNSGVPVNVDVVATVNGVEILKSDYESQLALTISTLKTQGVDVENAEKLAEVQSQVLEGLINNELVVQGIASAGIKTSEEEVENQIQTIISQVGGEDKFKEELVKANLTEEQLRENIAKQTAVQTYLAANVDISKITVSDEEVLQFYNDYKSAQTASSPTAEVPPLKDLSEQIKQQIIANKQQALVNEFLTSLQSKAQIERSL